MEEYSDDVFDLLDNGAHIYFCGLKGMMPGIQDMLERVAGEKGCAVTPHQNPINTPGRDMKAMARPSAAARRCIATAGSWQSCSAALCISPWQAQGHRASMQNSSAMRAVLILPQNSSRGARSSTSVRV